MSKKGFTLPELLVAAMVMLIALSAIMLTFVSCFSLNRTNREASLVITHAEYVMEDIKATSFNSILSKIASGDWDWNSTEITTAGLTALPSENITTDSFFTNSSMAGIGVVVSWVNSAGRPRNLTLETLIEEP